MTPSSGSLQTFEIYRIKSEDSKQKLANAAHDQQYVAEAPLLLVFCANPLRSLDTFGERKYLFSVQDATIAAAYAQLASCSLGLSSVWTKIGSPKLLAFPRVIGPLHRIFKRKTARKDYKRIS